MIKVLISDGDGTLEFPNPSPEIEDLLLALPKINVQLAIASNSAAKTPIIRRFMGAGFNVPSTIITKQDTRKPKPSAEFVYLIQQATGVGLNEIAYLGDDDRTDAFCAINAKVLPIAAFYSSSQKPKKYGLQVHHPKALLQYLSTFGQQDAPYFGWSLRNPDAAKSVEVFALFGEHGKMHLTGDLKTVLKKNRDVKIGSKEISLCSLLFHYLLSQIFLSGLRLDIDWITVYPGSTANSLNPLLVEFSKLISPLFRQAVISDLLIRHKNAPPAKLQGSNRDIMQQFLTIMVNDGYRKRIKGKTILVLDDFTTSGNSLETARQMLLRAGAGRVISIAIAKYRRDHTITRISGSWDPFKPCTLEQSDIQCISAQGLINDQADDFFSQEIWPVYSK